MFYSIDALKSYIRMLKLEKLSDLYEKVKAFIENLGEVE